MKTENRHVSLGRGKQEELRSWQTQPTLFHLSFPTGAIVQLYFAQQSFGQKTEISNRPKAQTLR